MKRLKIPFILLFFLILSLPFVSQAQTPDVQLSGNTIVITPPSDPNFEAMNVRIMSPGGLLVVDTRTYGDPVSYVFSEDGTYRWEVDVVLTNPNATMSDPEHPDEYIVNTVSGKVEIVNGNIAPEKQPQERPVEENEHSFFDSVKDKMVSFVRNTMETIISSAQAADLVTSDYNADIWFNDTSNGSASWGSYDWIIRLEGATSSSAGYLRILNWRVDTSTAYILLNDAGTNGLNTMYLYANGDLALKNFTSFFYNNSDISLSKRVVYIDYQSGSGTNSIGDINVSNGAFFVDGSTKRVGIGTTTPYYPVTIKTVTPEIELNNTSDNRIAHIQFYNNYLTFEGNTQQDIVNISGSAPANSLNVNSSGTVEMKNADVSFSGSNSAGDGLSKLVTLSANNAYTSKTSDVGFSLYNAREDFRWNFRTDESSQGFSATKEGTGGAEFLLKNTTNSYQNVELHLGNGAYCSSTGQWVNASSKEYKEDIKPLSSKEALLAFEQLKPVTFKFKRDKTKRVNVGFIAEEVPDIVATADRKGINSLEVVALLTKVVQEQKKMIEELKKEVEKQKEINKKLSKRFESFEKEQISKVEELQRKMELLHSAAFVK